MNIVILSGGSGKRLWPLSNDIMSKQFLKLLKNPTGDFESMAQRVMRQINAAHPDANVFVSCNAAHVDILHSQITSAKSIVEPSRRDTFPAISLAAAYLRYNENLDESDVFVVCPIDVFAESRYFDLLADVKKLTERHEIGLLGVTPTYPSEKYGYILQKDGIVTGFVEKPSAGKAEQLISGGALWNCGVFALKIGYVLERAKKYADFDCFESLYEQYSKLPQISFDYEVVEKERSIGSVMYGGVWKDLGTWNTLTEEMESSSIGSNVLISENCRNTHVLNMLNIPIIAQEINDAVIIASHDGILVSSKHGSSFLKPLAEQINLRPMYEQRRWGNYRILDYKQIGETPSIIKRTRINAGQSVIFETQTEKNEKEILVIIRGKGILTENNFDSVISPGSVIQINHGEKKSLLAATDIELIEIQWGDGEL